MTVTDGAHGACSSTHSSAMFTIGLGTGLLVAVLLQHPITVGLLCGSDVDITTGHGGPVGVVGRMRAMLESFRDRVDHNRVFWASAAQVAANTCFGTWVSCACVVRDWFDFAAVLLQRHQLEEFYFSAT